MEQHSLGDLFDYSIIKSKRKTLSIRIEEDGSVVVKAPSFLTEKEIEQFVIKKQEWILVHMKDILEQKKLKKEIRFESGTVLPYQGEDLILEVLPVEPGKKTEIIRTKKHLFVCTEQTQSHEIHQILMEWYLEEAKKELAERLTYYAKIMSLTPAKLTLRDAKTRWGSCSSKGNIMLNWRLILTPPDVIDYVIVHELCHLKEMNHSKAFWELVEEVIPDYKIRRKWLKEHYEQKI